LTSHSARLGPEYVDQLDLLRDRVADWEALPLAVLTGRLRAPGSEQLDVRDELVREVMARASQIDGRLSLQTRRLVAEMRRFERGRLLLLAGLFPLALLGLVLTALFARRALWNHQLVLHNAVDEALLRDAMTALTGDQVLPAALNRIATNAMRMAAADGAFIEYSGTERTEVEILAAVGTGAPSGGVRIPFAGSFTDELIRAGAAELIANASILETALARVLGKAGLHDSALAVPLRSNGDVDGALVLLQSAGSVQLRDVTIARIRLLGVWAALALRRQHLAARLEAEHARLEAVIEEIPIGMILAEAPSGRLLSFNRQAVELWGSPARVPQTIDEYANWHLYRLEGRSYESGERPLARSILNGEVVQGEEAEIERIDGTRRTVLINSAPIRDARGGIIAGVAAVSDISDEKRREQDTRFLDEISRQLASTLDYDATIDAILQLLVPRLADFASVHHRVDDRMIRKWAAAGADPNVAQLFERVDQEYPLPLPSAHPVAVAIRTGKSQLRETVEDQLLKAIARDERQLQWLRSLGMHSAMAVPLIVRGKTVGALLLVSLSETRHYDCNVLAFAEEIARRAALAMDNAQLFRRVNENARAARFLSDAALSLSGSLEFEELLRRVTSLAVPFSADFAMAYATDEQGLARHVASAHRDSEQERWLIEAAGLYRPDPANLACTVSRALNTGRPVLIERVTARHLDEQGFGPRARKLFGELAPVSWMTIPLIARDRTLGAIVFASSDPARRYGAEDLWFGQRLASRAALAMQNALLYRGANEALTTRDEVLAIVSHDLRNPLHTIGMSVQLLQEFPLAEEERSRQLDVIGRAKVRMDRLIQDLLDVTRVESGRALSIELRRECPATFIREACQVFAGPAREKRVQFECTVPADIPDVLVDCGRILQVLSNLIDNALKFTPEGGRIEVRATPDTDAVQVSVQDTGPGIPPEDLDRIFHAFWQAPRSARRGAGLGLSISRGIIEQHGGRMWAESREGAGSTLSFTLPLADVKSRLHAAD
jgi:PAS domain S-box-containing protein